MKGAILALIGIGWLAGQAKGCVARVGITLYTVSKLKEIHDKNQEKKQARVKRRTARNQTIGKKTDDDHWDRPYMRRRGY